MFASKTEYDRGVNTFSPEGRIFQIEYALQAIKLGSTSLGIRTPEGVLIAAEKRVPSSLVIPSSMNKIMEIDSHILAVMSGLVADARILVEHARVEAQNHRFTYNEPMCVESCTLATCDLSIQFGESGGKKKLMSRPFGVSLLIAGVDDKGPQLWLTDPSGTYTQFDAHAIGAGGEAAQTVFSERYHRNMTLEEAENLAIDILKQVIEDKLTKDNVEVAVVSAATGKAQLYDPAAIQRIMDPAFRAPTVECARQTIIIDMTTKTTAISRLSRAKMSSGIPADPLVRKAVAFLKTPAARNGSVDQKILFLKRKGLTDDQIHSAFAMAGESVPLEKIKAVVVPLESTPTNGFTQQGQTQGQGLSGSSYTAYPAAVTAAPPAASGSWDWDWRNVVIGVGAVALATVGAAKAWTAFSPYELRRRDEGWISDGPITISEPAVPSRTPPPLPSLPPLPVPAPSTAQTADLLSPPSLVGAAAPAEIEKLQQEIQDLKNTLEAERKSNADISIRASKFRSEKLVMVHQNNRLEEEIQQLKEEIKELKAAAMNKVLEDAEKMPDDPLSAQTAGQALNPIDAYTTSGSQPGNPPPQPFNPAGQALNPVDAYTTSGSQPGNPPPQPFNPAGQALNPVDAYTTSGSQPGNPPPQPFNPAGQALNPVDAYTTSGSQPGNPPPQPFNPAGQALNPVDAYTTSGSQPGNPPPQPFNPAGQALNPVDVYTTSGSQPGNPPPQPFNPAGQALNPVDAYTTSGSQPGNPPPQPFNPAGQALNPVDAYTTSGPQPGNPPPQPFNPEDVSKILNESVPSSAPPVTIDIGVDTVEGSVPHEKRTTEKEMYTPEGQSGFFNVSLSEAFEGPAPAPRVKKFLHLEVSSDEETPQRPRVAAHSATPATPQPFASRNEGDSNEVTGSDSVEPQPHRNGPVVPPAKSEAFSERVPDRKEVLEKTREKSYTRSGSNSSNLTIYERSKRQAAASAQRLEKLRFALNQEDRDEYTFRPVISKRAKMLRRSPLDAVESVERYRARLRQHLLDRNEAEECTFTPRICPQSSVIIHRRRSQSENDISVAERLYRQRSGRKGESLHPLQERNVRTPQQIEEHIASLYAFEERKEDVLEALREQQHSFYDVATAAKVRDVVSRLAAPRTQINSEDLYDEGEASPPRNEHHRRQHALYVQRAKARGLRRWFDHFSAGKENLTEADLEAYAGIHTRIRDTVAALLSRTTQASWCAKDFHDTFVNEEVEHGLPLWRIRIHSDIEPEKNTFTFHPRVDSVSSALASRRKRAASAFERLYVAARESQLAERQRMLENVQQQLREEELKQLRHIRMQRQWHRFSQEALAQKHVTKDRDADNCKEEIAHTTPTSDRTDLSRDQDCTSRKSSLKSSHHPSVEATLQEVQCPEPSLPSSSMPEKTEVKVATLKESERTAFATPSASKKTSRHMHKPKSSVLRAVAALEQALFEVTALPASDSSPITEIPEGKTNVEAADTPFKKVDSNDFYPSDFYSTPNKLEGPEQNSHAIEASQVSPTAFTKSTPTTDTHLRDLLLECSMCRYPSAAPTHRAQAQHLHKRRLKELGKALSTSKFSRYSFISNDEAGVTETLSVGSVDKMSLCGLIEQRVRDNMDPIEVKVEAINVLEKKYSLSVTSKMFEGLSLLKRHKAVNNLFSEELLSGDIHALTITAKAP
eukprot:gene10111-7077_t